MKDAAIHLSEKTISFTWNHENGSCRVKIELPDTRQNSYTVWGDWGPMYEIDINPKELIKISYDGNSLGTIESDPLDLSRFHLNSPALWKQREKYPFFFVIPDKKRNMVFHLYSDVNGNISYVEAAPLDRTESVIVCELG